MTDMGGGASLLPYTPAGVTGSNECTYFVPFAFGSFSSEIRVNFPGKTSRDRVLLPSLPNTSLNGSFELIRANHQVQKKRVTIRVQGSQVLRMTHTNTGILVAVQPPDLSFTVVASRSLTSSVDFKTTKRRHPNDLVT